MSAEPLVIQRIGLLARVVCVPSAWTDEQVIAWLEREESAGTRAGWCVRAHQGRNPCADLARDAVHMVLGV